MYDNQYGNGAPSAGRPRRAMTEALIAVTVAAIVASVVVLFGRDNAGGTPVDDTAGQSTTPTFTASESPSPTESATSATPSEEPTEDPVEVTKINVSADPGEFTGVCPTTVTVRASIFTNTGPVTAHYQWVYPDGASAEETVRFGGPGPQRVTVTDEIDVSDDDTVSVRLKVTVPNERISSPAESTVTCIPTARTWLDFDEICASDYEIVYHGSITVPHGPMTVKYTWERSDNATGPVYTVNFPAGGKQTMNVPDNTWHLWTSGEFSQRIKIISPFEYTSNWSTFKICP